MNTMFFKNKKREYNRLQMEEKVEEVPFSSYPRPQLKRDSFICLNGRWSDGVLVPFPLESELSGFKGDDTTRYTYRRKFEIPEDFIKDKVLLHFGAVDNKAKVYVDGEEVGSHVGGYLPFEIDITRFGAGTHELKVKVKDETSTDYPYGKQTKSPGGMWYTPVSGIWGSVWLESVPNDYIKSLRITPSLTDAKVEIEGGNGRYDVKVYDAEYPADGNLILEKTFDSPEFVLDIDTPKVWSPEKPNLYSVRIKSGEDMITSYFALRLIDIREVDGYKRICLNGRPYFFHGVLDQGYYPQGIFLPNNESGFEKDILKMKELGFNTLRKHIKVEPECFYEACDRLGMVVFQDMVNNAPYSFLRDTALPTVFKGHVSDKNRHKNSETRKIFKAHSKGIVDHLYNHPCVLYYTIFNEGWGQFDSDYMYDKFCKWDHTRIIDSTSGWFKQKKSDVESIHCYFKPIKPVKSDKPIIVSEMGGYSLRVEGHYFNKNDNYGYKTFTDEDVLSEAIIKLYEDEVLPYIEKGLCGNIYTQVSDVEDETNGFYTYDRKVCKINKEAMLAVSEKLKVQLGTVPNCTLGESLE